jgi:hypothetical protein
VSVSPRLSPKVREQAVLKHAFRGVSSHSLSPPRIFLLISHIFTASHALKLLSQSSYDCRSCSLDLEVSQFFCHCRSLLSPLSVVLVLSLPQFGLEVSEQAVEEVLLEARVLGRVDDGEQEGV